MEYPFVLTIPTDLRMISVARTFVEAICQTGNLDRATTHAIVLAIGEAVTNVIRHAHRHRPEAHIQVFCRLETETMEILLLDEGEPFDVKSVPRLDPTEMRLGGRGVYLMRAVMDELNSQPRPEKGNVLRMLKRLRRREAG